MKSYNYHMISMPYANCHVEFIVDDFSILRNIRLWSYSTRILDVSVGPDETDAIDIFIDYYVGCSTTTARHVNRFTRELTGSNLYFQCRDIDVGGHIWIDGMMLNAVEMFEHYVNVGKVIR